MNKSNLTSYENPRITFALIAYNQQDFVSYAIEGAFSQRFDNLEILLSDDRSNDNTYKIMEKMANEYNGPHIIKLNRNENNLGLSEHVNKIVNLSNGKYIVLAAGDDISLPQRSELSWKILENNSDCACISFGSNVIRNNEKILSTPNEIEQITYEKFDVQELIKNYTFHTNGAARTFRKSVFDFFGPLMSDCPTEDSTILLRSLLLGSVLMCNTPLVYHRIHSNNISISDKYHINYDLIHEQYILDLNKAYKKQKINRNIYIGVKSAINKRLKRRKISSKFMKGRNKAIIFFKSILFSNIFTKSEKKKYLYKLLSDIKLYIK